MAKDISSLTLKDLRRIYHFLNPRSRLTASLVCKQWLQAIDCPELLCDVRVKFSGEINEALVLFSRMTRRFQWFSFYRVDIGNPVVEFLLKCNGTIDWCMTEIFQMQNLTKLDLRSCSKISHVSYVMAVSILKAFKLKHLNLAFTKISDRSLFELLERNPKICYLNASGIDISNKTLNMICRNLTLLESLMLESCPTISDSGLTGEFENYSDSITPTPLSNLKYLRQLNLGKNNRITNRGCVKAIRFQN
ncbi:hypothetical protein TNCV_2751981 [Trichonephila clavipes]|nr:hypothetical protein TNCV_2751981 [Trichonephila clavipes]